LGERREGVKEWYPPVNPIVYNSQCVLEEIQEPGRKKRVQSLGNQIQMMYLVF